MKVVGTQPILGLDLVHCRAEELTADARAHPGVLAPPAGPILGAIPLVAVQVEDLRHAPTLGGQSAQGEVDRSPLGP
jgi:hypothetical protein